MTDPDHDLVVERFHPTSGRFSGIVGLVTAGVILALSVWAWDPGLPLGVAIVACLGALLVWAALLRPALWVTERDLVLRGMFRTDRVALAAIDSVVVTQVLVVTAGSRRYVSPVIGFTARQVIKGKISAQGGARSGPPTDVANEVNTHQLFVEARILHLAQESRDRLGIRAGSPEQAALADDVRHTYAWPELVGVAALVIAFVVWLIR